MNNSTETASTISVCSNGINVSALTIGLTIGLSLVLVVSLAGNSAIGVIVYKTPSLREPINYLIMNMAMSDLIFPLILIPWRLVSLNTSPAGHWLIGGPLGHGIFCFTGASYRAQLLKGRLVLNPGFFFFLQKHFLG